MATSPYLLEALLYVLLLFLVQQLARRDRREPARRGGDRARPGGTPIPSRSSWPMRSERFATLRSPAAAIFDLRGRKLVGRRGPIAASEANRSPYSNAWPLAAAPPPRPHHTIDATCRGSEDTIVALRFRCRRVEHDGQSWIVIALRDLTDEGAESSGRCNGIYPNCSTPNAHCTNTMSAWKESFGIARPNCASRRRRPKKPTTRKVNSWPTCRMSCARPCTGS